MKYKLETMLAFRALEETIWKSIKNATITEDLILEFEVDLKSNRGKYKRQLKTLLKQPLTDEYKTLLATKMLAEGYICFPVKGGWTVINPKKERYNLTENDCDCNDKTILNYDGPCKHLILRDYHLLYRSKIQAEKERLGM